MADIGHTETIEPLGKVLSPEESSIVDSVSLPHSSEYVSAKHALALDSTTLRLVDEDIETLRVRIAQAQAQMRHLEGQREAVRRRMSIHRARLSPIRAVPDQILQEIFQRCLPDSPYIVPDAHSAPLVLSHICRRWRIVAQGTSELWSSIALYDRGVWNCEMEVEMVKRWLDRSRMRPIRMSITCPSWVDCGLDQGATCSDILQLAIAHSSQLHDLFLNANRSYLRHFMDQANLSALQSAVISLQTTQRIDDSLELDIPTSMTASNLRRITFRGDGQSIDFIPRTIFSQITHLSFDCDMTLDLALLSQDFPRLQHLTLTLSLSLDTLNFRLPSQGDHKIIIPSLLRLEIYLEKDMLEFGDHEELEVLLDQLALPVLQTLAIAAPLTPRFQVQTGLTVASWENHADWVHSPHVAALLSRSQYAQPRLELWDLGFSLEDPAVGAK